MPEAWHPTKEIAIALDRIMNRPTVYLDTTIISAYWYDGADLMVLARRLRTRDWWETERPSFSTWISNVTEAELRDGASPRQRECAEMARRIHHLPITRAAEEMQESSAKQD